MTPDEVELIRDVISEAVQVSTEYALDEGSAIVEAFLDAGAALGCPCASYSPTATAAFLRKGEPSRI
jgi:hypothetical protein